MSITPWPERKLGELIDIKHGYAFEGEYFTETGSHIVLTPGNFHDAGGFKSKEGKEKWYSGPIPTDYVLSKGDLIVAMTEQAEGLLGSGAIVPESDRYLHNQRLGLVQIRDRRQLDQKFAFFLFNFKPVRQQIRASASGVKIRHTAPSRIADVRLRVPPLVVQKRITGILLAYDELIANCDRRIRILETMARALYREWFVDLRFPGHELVPHVPSKLGRIPETWKVRPFGDTSTIHRDGINPVEFPEEEFEHFSIPAFDDGMQASLELGATILSTKYLIGDRCVLLSKLNPRIPRIWLPAPSGLRRAITSTEFLVLKPREGISREFIHAMCSSESFADRFASLAIGTSTSHQRVKPENLTSMPTAVPDDKTVRQFTNLVSPLLALSQVLRKQKENMTRTRDLLLPRLLSGQVELGT